MIHIKHVAKFLATGSLAGVVATWVVAQEPSNPPAAPQPPSPQAPLVGQESPAEATPPSADPSTETDTAAEPSQPNLGRLDENMAENWLAYGGNNHATRYTPSGQITRENVDQLEVAWHFHTGDLPPDSDDPDVSPSAD